MVNSGLGWMTMSLYVCKYIMCTDVPWKKFSNFLPPTPLLKFWHKRQWWSIPISWVLVTEFKILRLKLCYCFGKKKKRHSRTTWAKIDSYLAVPTFIIYKINLALILGSVWPGWALISYYWPEPARPAEQDWFLSSSLTTLPMWQQVSACS